jgi:hypothetical protein
VRQRMTRGYGASLLILAVCLGTLLVVGCARQPEPPATGDLPGFFTGLLHGFLMFFSLIGSIFTDVRVYTFPNSGGWYDLGYVLGASMFWGGGGAGAKSSRGRGQSKLGG